MPSGHPIIGSKLFRPVPSFVMIDGAIVTEDDVDIITEDEVQIVMEDSK